MGCKGFLVSWSLTLPAIGTTTAQHTCAVVVCVPTLAPKPEREMAVYPTVLSVAGWVRDESVHASCFHHGNHHTKASDFAVRSYKYR